MHDDEVATDTALVRRLVATQFPRWASLPVEPVESSGTDNAGYRLGADLVVRLPRHERTEATLARECRWLPWLAPSLPLAIPAPLAVGRPGEGYPFGWAIYRWLPGEDATVAAPADLSAAARDVVRFVLALQAVDATDGPPPGRENAFRGVPLRTRDEQTRAAIVALGDAIDAEAVTAAWDVALLAPDWTRDPVWFHGDLDARNLLVHAGRLSGVIDFGCVGVGDPACDVAVAWKLFSGKSRRVFRAALDVDDGTWARGRGWALSQALIALPYYTLETNPALVREAQRWLSAVLTDSE